MRMIDAALAYTQPNGYRPPWAIIPVVSGGKRPYLKDWNNQASHAPETVKRWWTENPQANIGLVTGEKNGIVVIDVDKGPDKHGDESLRSLEEQLGKLPDTVEAITAHGGRHLLFKYPTGHYIGSPANTAPYIDIRGNGGQIVVEPSTVDGNQYTWEASSRPNETPLAELPPMWIEWLDKVAGKFVLPDVIELHTRNQTLFKYACSLRAQGKDKAEILAAVTEANTKRCTEPLPIDEINTIVDSAAQYPQGQADEQPTPRSRPRLTLEALAKEMSDKQYAARYNKITGEYEPQGRTASGRRMNIDDLITLLHNNLADSYKGCSIETLSQYVSFVAREKQYNPVLDWLDTLTWDGESRLPQLFDIIGINGPTDQDTLSRTLVTKWLLQTVALLFNDLDDPFGADGVLVFNGEQGAGKTSLFRHLAIKDAWFCEGATIKENDKDTTRRVITTWISELGEVESTLKSDISALKAFVSASVDKYRLPYGKTDIVTPRMTSLCATCNSDRYLIDPTGNRRWWSIPFTGCNHEKMLALDAPQLWAEIYAIIKNLTYKEKSAIFRLTHDEREKLDIRNGDYEKPIKAQTEIEDILAGNYHVKEMTCSTFKEFWSVLKPYSAPQIGAALAKMGIQPCKRTTAARFYKLPIPPGYDNMR